jgi:hypothetical protein
MMWQSRRYGCSGGRESVGRGCSPKSVALAGALGDRMFEAGVADGGVDRGGADVGVAGELADCSDVGAGVGEVGAERVAQHVRGASVLGEAGSLGVTSDDAGDVARGQRSRRLAGAWQREQQVLAGRGRPGLDPGGDRREVLIERDGVGCGRVCRSGRSPTSSSSGRSPGAGGNRRRGDARRRRSRAAWRLRRAAGRRSRAGAAGRGRVCLARAAVGHPQQPRPFVVIEGPWLPARDAR